MKQVKKLPRLQLEKFSTIFTQLGLVLVLFIVFISLEHQTEVDKPIVSVFELEDDDTIYDFVKIPTVKKKVVIPEKKINKAKRQVQINKPIINYVEPVKNEVKVIETITKTKASIIDNTIKTNTAVTTENKKEGNINKTVDSGPVILKLVSKAPIFKGCENLSETESRKCLDKKMRKIVNRHFDTSLANELGLKKGNHSIYTQFVIDKEGKVSNIKVRANNKTLDKEAKRVVGKIPDFIPGEHEGKKVGVKYSLPIKFQVE